MVDTVFVVEFEKSGDGVVMSLSDRAVKGTELNLITSDYYHALTDALFELDKLVTAHDGWEHL
jgi:hypothetical protein